MTNYKEGWLPPAQGLYDPANEKDACGVGFIASIKGEKSNQIVKDGIHILERLTHRGATGSDRDTGDGAGLLIQMPHEFMLKVAKEAKISLPEYGSYASGMVFLPQDKGGYEQCKKELESAIVKKGQKFLGWRKVPVNNRAIGYIARESEPVIEQVFIGRGDALKTQLEFERKLYVIRKIAENAVMNSKAAQKSYFYITTLSSRVYSFKGLLLPKQADEFYLDLKDHSIKSAICLVHSRYSTNTFPTWDLSQPFRYLAHNGEINTLRGNINWMRSKEGLLKSEFFNGDIEEIKPVIRTEAQSDSATLDNAFELLALSGRSLPHAMMMLIPGAWEDNAVMDDRVKDFFKYHACFMEPWDGPAAIAFTDGLKIGAVLDRNGLRPARLILTKDGRVIMASEAGVIDAPIGGIEKSTRLEPGKIFFIDTEQGKIITDSEIKKEMAGRKPYGEWLKSSLVEQKDLPKEAVERKYDPALALISMKAFGYTREDLKDILRPLAAEGKDPVGSMGNDLPLAVFSKNSLPLFNYFKQLFAQVTNPPIDSTREKCVMSLSMYLGKTLNFLEETPQHCNKLQLKSPLLRNEELKQLINISSKGFKTKVIYTLFNPKLKGDLQASIDRINADAIRAVKDGYTIIVLSDRGVAQDRAAIPSLLAVGAVHQELIRNSLRAQISIVLESGEPREVHHFNTLIGFGAEAVNPYLAYEAIEHMIAQGELNLDYEKALDNFKKGVHEGLLKVIAKMGISTVQSYCGGQIFEALGLHQEVVDKCFTGTVTRIGGADFAVLEQEAVMRHRDAYPEIGAPNPLLKAGGIYQWKKDGEFHMWNPDTIATLQDATRNNDYAKFREFVKLSNSQSGNATTLRSLLKFKQGMPIKIEEVEPVDSIVKRFVTGAMSFGSISRGAHEAMAIAMNRLGGRSNTGEGGEDPARFKPLPNGDSARSSIKQVASGRFGVTTNYLVNADEIQIKMAQGAKPGEGGQLPGHKVSEIIAKTRYTTPGVTLISPPPHHDIYSIEDLKQLIFDLKNTNPRARISVKLVSEPGVGTIAAGVAKGFADMILISGYDGGTGASPKGSIMHAGLPWELGISETHQTLVMNSLRSRVRLQTDGQLKTGKDVVMAAMLGAEEFGFATIALIVLGCVMLRHCHLNNCALGVATQDELLQKRFRGMADYLVNYLRMLAQNIREEMAALGFIKFDEMIGRCDMLELDRESLPWKAGKIDYSKLLFQPLSGEGVVTRFTTEQKHEINDVLDRKMIEMVTPALDNKEQIKAEIAIQNTDRACGAMLSGEICRKYGEDALLEDTVQLKFTGIAGQSFGAWLTKGVTFELEGMSNDYVGKGISGGKIIIYPCKKCGYEASKNTIIGNTTFYGAIRGEAYIRGIAGERFCIRNSGLYGVVEGVGDHGCEYMTGGRVLILGATGRNFGAGMSGGIAYVYNEDGMFEKRCNRAMVDLDPLDDDDRELVVRLLSKHYKYTDSDKAKKILDDFETEYVRFIKVYPKEYKAIIEAQKAAEEKMNLSTMNE